MHRNDTATSIRSAVGRERPGSRQGSSRGGPLSGRGAIDLSASAPNAALLRTAPAGPSEQTFSTRIFARVRGAFQRLGRDVLALERSGFRAGSGILRPSGSAASLPSALKARTGSGGPEERALARRLAEEGATSAGIGFSSELAKGRESLSEVMKEATGSVSEFRATVEACVEAAQESVLAEVFFLFQHACACEEQSERYAAENQKLRQIAVSLRRRLDEASDRIKQDENLMDFHRGQLVRRDGAVSDLRSQFRQSVELIRREAKEGERERVAALEKALQEARLQASRLRDELREAHAQLERRETEQGMESAMLSELRGAVTRIARTPVREVARRVADAFAGPRWWYRAAAEAEWGTGRLLRLAATALEAPTCVEWLDGFALRGAPAWPQRPRRGRPPPPSPPASPSRRCPSRWRPSSCPRVGRCLRRGAPAERSGALEAGAARRAAREILEDRREADRAADAAGRLREPFAAFLLRALLARHATPPASAARRWSWGTRAMAAGAPSASFSELPADALDFYLHAAEALDRQLVREPGNALTLSGMAHAVAELLPEVPGPVRQQLLSRAEKLSKHPDPDAFLELVVEEWSSHAAGRAEAAVKAAVSETEALRSGSVPAARFAALAQHMHPRLRPDQARPAPRPPLLAPRPRRGRQALAAYAEAAQGAGGKEAFDRELCAAAARRYALWASEAPGARELARELRQALEAGRGDALLALALRRAMLDAASGASRL
eukprot:tig00000857_g4942.t1